MSGFVLGTGSCGWYVPGIQLSSTAGLSDFPGIPVVPRGHGDIMAPLAAISDLRCFRSGAWEVEYFAGLLSPRAAVWALLSLSTA